MDVFTASRAPELVTCEASACLERDALSPRLRNRRNARLAQRFADLEQRLPSVLEAHALTGDSDYLLRIYARSVEHLDELLRNDLSKLPGVHRLSTTVCLKTIKQHAPLTPWASEGARA